MSLNFKRLIATVILGFLFSGFAQATNVTFSGLDIVGDGSPGFGAQETLADGILTVDVSLFDVTATDAGYGLLDDSITFHIQAEPNFFISRITLREGFTATIVPGSGGLALGSGRLSVFNLGEIDEERTLPFVPFTSSGDNLSSTYVDVIGQSLTDAKVTISNTLTAFIEGTHIQKNLTSVEVTLQPLQAVPIPAAVWLFGSALIGFVTFTRRRIS